MKSEKKNGMVFPQDLFLTQEEDGTLAWWEMDPLSRGALPMDLGRALTDFYGHPDRLDPFLVRLNVCPLHRTIPFAVSLPGRVRGELRGLVFRDREGSTVEVLESASADDAFPINAVVLGDDGAMRSTRTYSLKGECSDGEALHTIFGIYEEKE